MSTCGPDVASWFGIGRWPQCTCGFAPRDNAKLDAHWREQGFTVHDDHGLLVRVPVDSDDSAR